MNFLDLNNDGKRDTKDGQIILAYIFAAVGIFLLVTALLGLDIHYRHLLQQSIADMQKKKEEE